MQEISGETARAATPDSLRRLAREGALSPAALERGLKLIGYRPSAARWLRFLNRTLLYLSVVFLVSGVFFFFAYNWSGMHRFVKLGLLQIAMLTAVAITTWRGLERLSGKVALLAAGLLVGALLAVYGQAYQTGADSYQLFAGWVLLIAGWVAISRFVPMWLVWLLLLNLAIVLYAIQVQGEVETIHYLVLFAINGGAWLAWELLHTLNISWLQDRWTPRLLSLLVLISLANPTWQLLIDRYVNVTPLMILMALLFIALTLILSYVYARVLYDPFMLILWAFGWMVMFNWWIVEQIDFYPLALLLIGFLFVAETAAAVMLISRAGRRWERGAT